VSGWFARAWSQVRERWRNLPANLRILLIGTAVALALAGAVLIGLSAGDGEQELVPLPGQPYAAEELAAVVAKLDEAGIPYRHGGRDGTLILVSRQDLLRAQLAVAQAGVETGPPGWELFDRTNLAATDFDRRVMLLRAMEGELSKAIGSLEPLKSATVKLSLPERSAFVRDQQPATAAVLVEPKPGRSLSPQEVEGIVRFLTGAVPGLQAENVVVIDHTGRALTSTPLGGEEPQAVEASRRLQAQLEYKAALEKGLQASLDRMFGPGNSAVMVSVTLDFDTRSVEATEYTQPQVRSRQETTETFQGTGAPPGGDQATGVDANSPNPPTYQTVQGAGSSSYEKEDSIVNYELGQIKTLEVKAPGQVREITVGVFLNQKVLQAMGMDSQGVISQVQQAVARAVGAPMENVTVAAIPFDNPLLEAFRTPEAEESREPVLSPVVLGLGAGAALLILVALLWYLRRRRAQAEALELLEPGVEAEELTAATLEAPDQAASPLPVPPEPEPTQEELIQYLGEEFLQKATDPVRRKLREEVRKLVESNPEMAAQLIRAWLAEERGSR